MPEVLCEVCGTEIATGDDFCPLCGTVVGHDALAEAAAAAEALNAARRPPEPPEDTDPGPALPIVPDPSDTKAGPVRILPRSPKPDWEAEDDEPEVIASSTAKRGDPDDEVTTGVRRGDLVAAVLEYFDSDEDPDAESEDAAGWDAIPVRASDPVHVPHRSSARSRISSRVPERPAATDQQIDVPQVPDLDFRELDDDRPEQAEATNQTEQPGPREKTDQREKAEKLEKTDKREKPQKRVVADKRETAVRGDLKTRIGEGEQPEREELESKRPPQPRFRIPQTQVSRDEIRHALKVMWSALAVVLVVVTVVGIALIGNPAPRKSTVPTTVPVRTATLAGSTAAPWVVSARGAPLGLKGGLLYSLTCPTRTRCWTAGNSKSGGTILATKDGGTTWRPQSVPQSSGLLAGGHIFSISCPSSKDCYAVGLAKSLEILETNDGGTTWYSDGYSRNLDGAFLRAIDCPSVADCWAVGGGPNGTPIIAVTTNGGSTWHSQVYPHPSVHTIENVSCPSTTVCYIIGGSKKTTLVILSTTDAGTQWNEQSPPKHHRFTTHDLGTLKCPAVNDCEAVGTTTGRTGAASILATSDGGAHWKIQHYPAGLPLADGDLLTLSCPDVNTCWATGGDLASAVILSTVNGGKLWSAQALPAKVKLYGESIASVSCPLSTSCTAVGSPAGNTVFLNARKSATPTSPPTTSPPTTSVPPTTTTPTTTTPTTTTPTTTTPTTTTPATTTPASAPTTNAPPTAKHRKSTPSTSAPATSTTSVPAHRIPKTSTSVPRS